MTGLDKLHVIGKDIDEIHQYATSLGIPWNRIEPVTGSNQLRVRSARDEITVNWVPDTAMHPAVQSTIRTQLSIRRCLGRVFEMSTRQITMTGYWFAP